jgi:trigger factor
MADDETKKMPEDNEPSQPKAETSVAEPDEKKEEKEKEFEFIEEPLFELDYKGDCTYEVKVTIPVANEAKLADDVFEELRHEAELPGFRRGRAPRKLIERRFAKVVRSDVEGRLVNAAFSKLLKDKKLDPLAPPEVEGFEKPEERKAGEPITFTLKFEVHPKVELGKYRGVAIERPAYSVSEHDLDEAVKGVRTRYSLFETVSEGAAADGDQVIISFRGTINGEEFPGGTAENYPYILGSKRFFPEFEKVLTGGKPGDTLNCEITFPDGYSVEHLRGRTGNFEIKINELKRRSMPELTDEFANQAGYEDLEDLRNKMTLRLQEGATAEGNEIAEARLLKTIIDSSTFELPKSLIETMAHEFYEETVKRLRQNHVPPSQLQAEEEKLREEARGEAIEAIKSWTTLNEIADAEGIEVTDDDFEKEAMSVSQRTGASVEVVAKYMGDEERRGRYERRLLHNKVMGALMSLAEITNKEVTREELDKADEDVKAE